MIRRFGTGLLLAVWLGPEAVSAAAATAEPPAASRPAYAGMALPAALRALQRQGLAIVFTSELVRPEMRVAAEPTASEPRQILDQVLAPHGLRARADVGGVLVVVAGPGAAGSVEGSVFAPGRRELQGAIVSARRTGGDSAAAREISTGADGSFTLDALEPGEYALAASAPGFFDQRVDAVRVEPGAHRRVVLQMQPQIYLQEEIVVQPSRSSLLLERPDSSFSLGREEIESLPHLGGDVFRAASLLPGVTGNDVAAEFSVHGGRRDEVQVLLDGQELYGSYHLKDYDNALSLVPAGTLAGVTLTSGSYPASHGDRMSAVLDLRTIEPSMAPRYVLGLSVLDGLASGSGRFAEGRGAWLGSARRGAIDLARDVIGTDHPRFWDLFGKAELETAAGLWGARILLASDGLGVDASADDGFERLDNDYRSTYAWLTHRSAPRPRWSAETLGSWVRTDTDRRSAGRDEEKTYGLRDRRDLEVLGFSQTWNLELRGGHSARLGLERRRYQVGFRYAKDLDLDLVVLAPFAAPRLTVHGFEDALDSRHTGIWASDRFSIDRLSIELGLRHDRHSATGDALWSPRFNAGWRLGDRAVVRASWGRFFQSQRPYELQVEDGERSLRPAELAEHSLLGYEALLPPNRLRVGTLRIELFGREIADPRPRFESLLEPINFFPETEPDRVRIAPERSSARGVELLMRGTRGQHFDWWVAYSYARAQDRIAGETVPRSLDQPHAGTIDLHFRLPRQWNLNLAWRVHSGWPTTPVAAAEVSDPDEPEESELVGVFGPLNSRRLPIYHRLDLRASRSRELRSGRLTFFVDVQNLYNRRNLAGFDLSLDEEAGTIELVPERWPGIFPSLGITWEF